MKYINKEYSNGEATYVVSDNRKGLLTVCEIPDGAEVCAISDGCHHFWKDGGNTYFRSIDETWVSCSNGHYGTFVKYTGKFRDVDLLWIGGKPSIESDNNHLKHNQYVLRWIEKWLNGEKVRYHLGEFTEGKSQWHNFTEGSLKYIQRKDIKFQLAPKYVSINGIAFKSVESLIKYVKNNYDLGE